MPTIRRGERGRGTGSSRRQTVRTRTAAEKARRTGPRSTFARAGSARRGVRQAVRSDRRGARTAGRTAARATRSARRQSRK